jgi:hypothetical protein
VSRPAAPFLFLVSSSPDPRTLEALLSGRKGPPEGGAIVVEKAPFTGTLADPVLPPWVEYHRDRDEAGKRCSRCVPPLRHLKPLSDPPGPSPWVADACTWLLCYWRARLLEISPRAVVAGGEALPHARAAFLAARDLGIPTFQLQHGLPMGWWGYAPSLATRVLAWGPESARRLASFGVEPGRIAVTGSPRFDALEAELAGLRGRRDEIRASFGLSRGDAVTALFEGFRTLPAAVAERVLGAVSRLLSERAEARLLIKVHPAEDPAAVAASLPPALSGAGGRVRVLSGEPAPVLAAADLVLSVTSTVAVEAAAAGVPVASFLPPSLSRWLFGECPFPSVRDGETLGKALDEALAGGTRDGGAVRELHFGTERGTAAGRLFAELERAGRRDGRRDPEVRRLFLALPACPRSPSLRARLRGRSFVLAAAGRHAVSRLLRRGAPKAADPPPGRAE